MRLLIVVPEECQLEGYIRIPAVEDVHYSRLVRYEDELRKLTGAVTKLLTEILAKPKKRDAEEVGINRVIAEFTWDSLIKRGATVEAILEVLEGEYSEIKAKYRRMTEEARGENEHCNRQLNAELNAVGNQEVDDLGCEEDFEFIECAYVAMARGDEGRFKKDLRELISLEYAIKLSSTSRDLLYKIYYLKRDSERILERIGKKYACERSKGAVAKQLNTLGESAISGKQVPVLSVSKGIDAGAVENYCAKDACDRKSEEQADAAICCARLYVRVCAFAGYVESLHRYGMPGRYKCKISSGNASELKRELKKVTKSLINAGIIEIGSDDEEYPFTQVPLQDFRNK